MIERSRKSIRRRLATLCGVSLFAIYVGWNLIWWFQGKLAPSMLTAATGIPSPTTGGTRSVRALAHGDLPLSLYYNAMTIPLVVLSITTVGLYLARRRCPAWVGRSWVSLLLVAWVLKLCSPIDTW